MIKRISLGELKPGMFVSSFDLPWFRHPFLTTRLGVVRDQGLIDELHRLGVRHVEVDLKLGNGNGDGEAVRQASSPPVADAPPPGQPSIHASSRLPSCPPSADLEKTARFARKLHSQAMAVARALMESVSRGGRAPIEEITPLVSRLVEVTQSNEYVMHVLLSLKTYDDYTYTHCLNLAALSVFLGNAMELGQYDLEQLGLAGILHDVGKCLLPREIVGKPGPLTEEEFARMKLHPRLGHDHLLKGGGVPETVLRAILEHHERMDGGGYPAGLSGGGIDRLSAIVSVVDIYDALTSDRVYRARVSPSSALRTLFGMRGKAFPEVLVDIFIKNLGIYPAFSVVQLRNGCYAWVTRQTPGKPLYPEVVVFCDRERRPVTRRRVDTWRLCCEMARREFEIERAVEPAELDAHPASGLF